MILVFHVPSEGHLEDESCDSLIAVNTEHVVYFEPCRFYIYNRLEKHYLEDTHISGTRLVLRDELVYKIREQFDDVLDRWSKL